MNHFFPLESAYLCPEPDCLTVGNNANRCPACANEHGLMSLSGTLNRPEFNLSAEVAAIMGTLKSVGNEVFGI